MLISDEGPVGVDEVSRSFDCFLAEVAEDGY